MQLDAIDQIAAVTLEGYLVRKDLVRTFSRQFPVPTYVVEFLLGRYCASTDSEEIEEGLEIVQRQLADRTVKAGDEELFKSRAREKGEVKIIDVISARLDAKTDSYLATLPSLRLNNVRINPEMVKQHERMLTGGFYAEISLGYDAAIAQEKNGRPFGIDGLREIQLSKRDVLDVLARARSQFSTGDWKVLLLRSIGIEPEGLSERAKNAFLLRMVPFVERNYNVVELGPRGTGKSHLFQQISPYAHLISGGKASVPRMFVNNATGQRGLVCQYDVVCFDEVSGVSFDQKDGVNIMKGYMESGEFSRGKESIRADGSIVLVGNFEVDVEHQQRVGHLLGPLPPEMRDDTAFMDRIHAYLPGWDVPKVNKELLTNHFGLVSDFLSECWSQLRNQSRVAVLHGRVHYGGALSGRDTNAVNKTASGLLKLLYPGSTEEVPDAELEWADPLGARIPPTSQGTAEADRGGRVPQHALQLCHGKRRRRAVRLDPGTSERRWDRVRSTGTRPGLDDHARWHGRAPRPVPHRSQRRPRIGRQGVEQAGARPLSGNRSGTPNRTCTPAPRSWSATRTRGSTSSASNSGRLTPPSPEPSSVSPS